MKLIERFKEILEEIKKSKVYEKWIPLWNREELEKAEDELAKLILDIENRPIEMGTFDFDTTAGSTTEVDE